MSDENTWQGDVLPVMNHSLIDILPMNGLRRNDDAMKNQSRY
jgi:hypothetical protein